PLTALDAQLRDALRREMNALLRELGVTTVYVTHDQAEAMALGDRIVVMSAGAIEQIGTPRDVYYRPASRAVARFIGTLNRLEGVWRDGALVTEGGALAVASPANELFFRPEDARLVDPSDAPLRGAVAHCAFLGERTRVTIEHAAPDPLVIDVPGRVDLARGTAVGVAIAAEGLIALA
ncbi:ABC transporter ATP-binding protein, partial [Burkholderia pseudomallei]